MAYATDGEDNTVSVTDVAQKKRSSVRSSSGHHRMGPDGSEISQATTGDNSGLVICAGQAEEMGWIIVGRKAIQVFATLDER